MGKLFRLLEQFYPNAKQVKNQDTRLAWTLALERYRYEDLKAAAIAYAEKNKFFPDLADLTVQCTQHDAANDSDGPAQIPQILIAHVREIEELAPTLEEMDRLMDLDYISAGVPHPSAARKMGWKPEYWVQVCKASLGVADVG